ncbi:MAG: AAA family ATPase, partial [Chlamydiales bacterium]|nr:AAA family ATPase [Chlamydiales bacterium]
MKVGSFFSSPVLTEVHVSPAKKAPLFDPILFSINQSTSHWDKFKDVFKSRSDFRKSIEAMASVQDPPLSDVANAFSSSDYHVLRKPLRTILKNLTRQGLGDLFTLLVDKSIEQGRHDSLHRCLALITPQELEPLVKEGIAASTMTPEETLQVFALAEKEYRKLVTSTEQSFTDKHVHTFGRMVRNFLDACLLSFRISDIGSEVTSIWEANEKIMGYTRLLSGPIIMFTALCTVCPVAVAFAVTAVLSLTIGLGALIYIKWFQESPETIYLTTNLLEQAKEGALTPVFAREAEIDEVLQALASSSDSHRSHPLLCGPSGVGKTEIVRGIAQRLATGNVPDCLKGKKLISINTADLVDKHMNSGGDDKLMSVLNKMGKN